MDVPDHVEPRIVYRFEWTRRIWLALWLGRIEIARVREPTATDHLILLAYQWRDEFDDLCDGSHK